MRIFDVAEVYAQARAALRRDPQLADLWVRGEIASVTYARSGHIYFCLRDATAQLDCVLFRHDARYLRGRLEAGQAVVAHGAIDLYDGRSLFQLYADLVEQEGVGAWRLQFELLYRQLEAEGLFATERKRPLPAFPRRIGLATSATGAVRHDIARILERRYPLAELVLVDCAVQGEEAPLQIVAALHRLNEFAASRLPPQRQHEAIDVIILARGGGAPEELAAFNDERVARAIFASAIPVVSAIGHETDYTIADLVADMRAPTPSAAAELVTPDVRALRETVHGYRQRLAAATQSILQAQRHAAATLRQQLLWHSPRAQVARQRQRVDELVARARLLIQQELRARAAQVEARRLQLAALSPETTLARGYALCYDAQRGTILTAADQVAPGAPLVVRLHRGGLRARVEHVMAPGPHARGEVSDDAQSPVV
ncbi:MAG TPA: exodeoxyribonuclease VII large subunit [Chloroflexota bacterium]|jgi:exodeoxyribonuclease VII large subunit|nr:exodeoxyribonuclease VII large subunit [Chloroflexota bacterium]